MPSPAAQTLSACSRGTRGLKKIFPSIRTERAKISDCSIDTRLPLAFNMLL